VVYGSEHNPDEGLVGAMGSARSRRARIGTPTLSVLLSGVFHALALLGAAAVVWRTAVAPVDPGAGAGVAFESPGDGLSGAGRWNPPTAEVAPPDATRARSEGAIGPALELPVSDAPLTGLATSEGDKPPTAAIGSFAASSLASGSLFSQAHDEAAGGAVAGLTDGAASVTFGGLGASSVSSVVYVVDCSGPMVTSLPMVIAELERSVGRLTASQRFGVVLARGGAEGGLGTESFAVVLVRATPSAKQLLHNWLAAAEPAGRSSPLAGMEAALALRPDAIFLLSRAIQRSGGGVWELGLDATMERLEELNPLRSDLAGGGRRVLIQTIQFLEEDPTGIMQAIGQRHGGGNGYRVVRRQQDLQTPDSSRPARAPGH
jgi:hypothetical protein